MKDNGLGYRIFTWFNYFLLVIMAVSFIFPFLNTFAKAFNDPENTALGGLTVFPRVWSLYNFRVLLSQESIPMAAIVTVARVITGTFLSLLVTFTAGYAFTKKGFRGRGAFLIFMMIPMYIGGGLIPYYLLLSKIHILNTFFVYIIPGAFGFFNMVVVRVYINSNVPESLEDAARIDGANDIYILLKIVLPLSAPILATIGLFTAVGHWNDWTTTLMFVTSKRLATLQYKLMQVLRESETIQAAVRQSIRDGNRNLIAPKATPESIQAALVMATTLPIVIVYPFLQKYFIKGAVIGALKD